MLDKCAVATVTEIDEDAHYIDVANGPVNSVSDARATDSGAIVQTQQPTR